MASGAQWFKELGASNGLPQKMNINAELDMQFPGYAETLVKNPCLSNQAQDPSFSCSNDTGYGFPYWY